MIKFRKKDDLLQTQQETYEEGGYEDNVVVTTKEHQEKTVDTDHLLTNDSVSSSVSTTPSVSSTLAQHQLSPKEVISTKIDESSSNTNQNEVNKTEVEIEPIVKTCKIEVKDLIEIKNETIENLPLLNDLISDDYL